MQHPANDHEIALDTVIDRDQPDFNLEEAADRIAVMRMDPTVSRLLDLQLLDRLQRLQKALFGAREMLERAEGVIKKLTAPPCFLASFIGLQPLREGEDLRAIVCVDANVRIVGFGDGVESAGLQLGDRVSLRTK